MTESLNTLRQRSKTHVQKRRTVISGAISKTPTTRTKTGCMTCRRRKKKCDEQKPICGNCHRANFDCLPCPSRKPCPTDKRNTSVTTGPAQSWVQDDSNTFDAIAETSHVVKLNVSMLPFADRQTSTLSGTTDFISRYSSCMVTGEDPHDTGSFLPISSSHVTPDDFTTDWNLDENIEKLVTPLSCQQHLQCPLSVGSGCFPGCFNHWDTCSTPLDILSFDSLHIYQPAEVVLPSPAQTALPFPIPGVDTQTRQRMFVHFHTIMAGLLTTSNGISNPMNDVIIPLAMEDPIIMDTLLGLSGSHMLKLTKSDTDPTLLAEKQRLHTQALQMQANRTHSLLTADSTQAFESPRCRERIFATSLLLCLHEICEGSSDSTSQRHLDTARQVITSANATQGSEYSHDNKAAVATTFHPFLVEFFLYHICLALVTMPSFLNSQDSIVNLTGLLSRDKSMVGVIEMLLDFIKRIAILRQQAQKEGARSPRVILNSIPIYNDLDTWRPQVPLSADQQVLADFYQKALSIWLFSIVNPDMKSHYQIQALVQEVTARMSNISDSVKACLLFPLFMVGGAAIRVEDREAVTTLFKGLRNWSSLGNIDVTFAVVENMWSDYDEGVPKAWDWTAQLEKKSMRILVT